MRIVPAGRALGLRARIVGVVMVTAVSTLAIAAVTLLGPLEHSLRNAEKTTLSQELNRNALRAFARLPLGRADTDPTVLESLRRAIVNLQKRLGATVYVFASPVSPGVGSVGVRPLISSGDEGDSFADVVRAFRTGRTVRSFGQVDGTEVAREAIPFTLVPISTAGPGGEDGGDAPASPQQAARGRHVYVLAVRRPIGEIPGAARAVNRAFLYAALAGLALSLVLGIPISARLVRRLRRLREAALELTDAGAVVEVPVDRVRDEVGDLSRALWIMQQRLGRQEQARREFVATASHELRTPLASLEGMLELLRDDLEDERPDLEDARALVERAHAQARRLGRLASDLLDLSRIDAQVRLRSEPVELGELCRAVLAEFELRGERRELVAVLREAGAPVWALGDPGSVAQIVRILLDNALRVSPMGEEVEVVLGCDGVASLSVCDRGPGVPEDEREAIFERFHRGRNTGGEAGFGLGLAIGRELARRMGGELVLEDRPPAGAASGAVFTLRLPLAPAADHETLAAA